MGRRCHILSIKLRQILLVAIDVDETSNQEGYLTKCQILYTREDRGLKWAMNNLTFLLKIDLQCPTLRHLRVCLMSVEVQLREGWEDLVFP